MRKSKKKNTVRAKQGAGVLQYKTYEMNLLEKVCCIGKGCVLLGVVSYLFYQSIAAFFFLLPFLYFYMRKEKLRLMKKRRQILQREFKEGIEALQAALDTGYSIENAFSEACRDLKMIYPEGSYITMEFGRIVQGIRMNKTVEDMLVDFGERSGLDEIQNFAEIFTIAKKSGGDMILIIQSTVQTIREKIEVQGEIETMMSGKRFEQRIMNLIPFGILLYVKFTSGQMMEVLYGNFLGVFIMTGCLGMYLLAVWLAQRIVSVEV